METIDPADSRLLITLDTGVLDETYYDVEAAARTLPTAVEYATISVSDRERERERERGKHETKPKIIPTIVETVVIGESSWGGAVLGSESGARMYEQIRAIISNGSYTPPDSDEHAHDGQRRQVLDAMALSDHVREQRDVFLTTHAKRSLVTVGETRPCTATGPQGLPESPHSYEAECADDQKRCR